MKKTALTLATIAGAIAAILAAPAQAGGKRLQFGGPLGSFEATPYAKNSSRSHSSYKKRATRATSKKARARKLAAQRAYARKLAAKKAAAKKAAARKTAAQRAAKAAAARKIAAQKAAARRIAANKAAAAKARQAESDIAAKSDTTADEDAKAAPVKASAIAATNTLNLDRRDDDASVTENDETEPVEAEIEEDTNDKAAFEKAELECKKYIPSAGLTITVPCGS